MPKLLNQWKLVRATREVCSYIILVVLAVADFISLIFNKLLGSQVYCRSMTKTVSYAA